MMEKMSEVEELAEKIPLKKIREAAKKHGLKTCRVKKLDLAKQIPIEELRRLAKEWQSCWHDVCKLIPLYWLHVNQLMPVKLNP